MNTTTAAAARNPVTHWETTLFSAGPVAPSGSARGRGWDAPVFDGIDDQLADALVRLGIARATDVVGGFAAWRSAGLPVDDRARG